MRTGKLNAEELNKYVFAHISSFRDEVALSAALGEDCAALKTDGYILLSSDPITAQMPNRSLGRLSVDVSCNDIAANGGEAVALTLTVIMPVFSHEDEIGEIMNGAGERAKELNVEIVGGHTEFSDCVTRPIICATAVGKAERLIAKSSLSAGDDIYLTKVCGIEGTVILAEKYSRELTREERAHAEELRGLLSVGAESRILRKYDGVTTMHDVTEGGILGAVAEIALAAGLGAEICEKDIPVDGVTEKLCSRLDIDPLKLIASGSMMFTGKDLDKAVKELESAGIRSSKIGRITAKKENVLFRKDGRTESFSTEPDKLLSALINGNNEKENDK